MRLHTHLTIKHHTQVMNGNSWWNFGSIDVDVRDINFASLLSSSNDYEFCFIMIQLKHILYHPMIDFNNASLDFDDRYISNILVNRLEYQVQLVIICIYMELNPKFS